MQWGRSHGIRRLDSTPQRHPGQSNFPSRGTLGTVSKGTPLPLPDHCHQPHDLDPVKDILVAMEPAVVLTEHFYLFLL